MINRYFIIFFLSVLQLTSASKVLQIHFNGLNGKHYIIKESEDLFKLKLIVMEPNGVDKDFELSHCNIAKVTYRAIKIQGNIVYIHLCTEEDEFLQVVDLATLSDDITNNNCIPIAETYFGKYKDYVYKVEKENILKRWLLTSDGKLINPVEVAETKLPISHVNVSPSTVKITTIDKSHDDSYVDEYHQDLPRCDVPDDGTPCDDGEVNVETPIETSFYHYFKIGIIIVVVFSFILILFGIGYYFLSLKFKSQRNSRNHLNIGSRLYGLINEMIRDTYNHDIPMNS